MLNKNLINSKNKAALNQNQSEFSDQESQMTERLNQSQVETRSKSKSKGRVEEIINHKINEKQEMVYLIKWKGYSESENTWEPEQNLINCHQIMLNYKKKKELQQKIINKEQRKIEIFDKLKQVKGSQIVQRSNSSRSNSDDQNFEVDDIVGNKFEKQKQMYLIKWKGFSDKQNTWEPEENLINCQQLIKRYLQKEKKLKKEQNKLIKPQFYDEDFQISDMKPKPKNIKIYKGHCGRSSNKKLSDLDVSLENLKSKKPQIEGFNENSQKIQASFEKGNKVLRILEMVKINDDGINGYKKQFKVIWRPTNDHNDFPDSIVTYDQLKEHQPAILCDFLINDGQDLQKYRKRNISQ